MLLAGVSTVKVRAIDAFGGEGVALSMVSVAAPALESKVATANFVLETLRSSVASAGEVRDTHAVVQAVAALASTLAPTSSSTPGDSTVDSPLGEVVCAAFYCEIATGQAAGVALQPSAQALVEEEARDKLLSALESTTLVEHDTAEAKLHVAQAVFQMSRTFLASQTDPVHHVGRSAALLNSLAHTVTQTDRVSRGAQQVEHTIVTAVGNLLETIEGSLAVADAVTDWSVTEGIVAPPSSRRLLHAESSVGLIASVKSALNWLHWLTRGTPEPARSRRLSEASVAASSDAIEAGRAAVRVLNYIADQNLNEMMLGDVPQEFMARGLALGVQTATAGMHFR